VSKKLVELTEYFDRLFRIMKRVNRGRASLNLAYEVAWSVGFLRREDSLPSAMQDCYRVLNFYLDGLNYDSMPVLSRGLTSLVKLRGIDLSAFVRESRFAFLDKEHYLEVLFDRVAYNYVLANNLIFYHKAGSELLNLFDNYHLSKEFVIRLAEVEFLYEDKVGIAELGEIYYGTYTALQYRL